MFFDQISGKNTSFKPYIWKCNFYYKEIKWQKFDNNWLDSNLSKIIRSFMKMDLNLK